jgi:sporulation protein YlmC with PRC-barrel domain
MRASELLASSVVDSTGRRVGRVRDVRVIRDGFRVAGLVIGGGPFAGIAHSWGYAEGRAQGPPLLRALTRRATRSARFVPVDRVSDWGDGVVELDADVDELPLLTEELR